MKKIVKDAVHCEHCGSTLKRAEEEAFCDECKGKIKEEGDFRYDITIFFNNNSHSIRKEFCSMKCLKNYMKHFPLNKKLVWFIGLPHQDFEGTLELLGIDGGENK